MPKDSQYILRGQRIKVTIYPMPFPYLSLSFPTRFSSFLLAFVFFFLTPRSLKRTSQRATDFATAFLEQTGVVLLNPEPAPKPASLAVRFLPAMDKFLALNAINVRETVDAQEDPQRHAILEQIKQAYAHYQAQVNGVVDLFQQWVDTLHGQLERQGAIRIVAPGEESIKTIQMMDRIRRQLDTLLERSKVFITQLQRSNGLRSNNKVQPLLVYGDEMFSLTKGKKTTVATARTSRSGLNSDQVKKDRQAWLAEWNSQTPDPQVCEDEEIPVVNAPVQQQQQQQHQQPNHKRGLKREVAHDNYHGGGSLSSSVGSFDLNGDSAHTSLEEEQLPNSLSLKPMVFGGDLREVGGQYDCDGHSTDATMYKRGRFDVILEDANLSLPPPPPMELPMFLTRPSPGIDFFMEDDLVRLLN